MSIKTEQELIRLGAKVDSLASHIENIYETIESLKAAPKPVTQPQKQKRSPH